MPKKAPEEPKPLIFATPNPWSTLPREVHVGTGHGKKEGATTESPVDGQDQPKIYTIRDHTLEVLMHPDVLELHAVRVVHKPHGDERQLHLKVRVRCGREEKVVDVLVDTGAQVSLVRRGLFKEELLQPSRRPVRLKVTNGEIMGGGTHEATISMEFSAVCSKKHEFDTDRPHQDIALMLMDIHTRQAKLVSMSNIVHHHDARFYPQTNTFFILAKEECEAGEQMQDPVIEMAMNGSIVWDWWPRDGTGLPQCARHRKITDCQHTNSVQYDAATGMLYLGMRAFEGFVALHKPTKSVRWFYAERPKFAELTNGSLKVCPGHKHLWPERLHQHPFRGFHSFLSVGSNRFSVFANQDASARSFQVDVGRGCLLPLAHHRHPGKLRGRWSMGAAYSIPDGIIIGTHDQRLDVWQQKQQSHYRLYNALWNDPVYLAPWLGLETATASGNVSVLIANHLWLPYAATASMGCTVQPQEALVLPQLPLSVTLPPYMGVVRVPLPEGRGPATFQLEVHVTMPYRAASKVKWLVTNSPLA